jgi:hypothetical protein
MSVKLAADVLFRHKDGKATLCRTLYLVATFAKFR